MAAARVEGHLGIDVLPDDHCGGDSPGTAELDVSLFTGIDQARNLINLFGADVVLICGAGARERSRSLLQS